MTILDSERQKQAKTFARIKRGVWLMDTIFIAVYMLVWLITSWAVRLRTWLTQFAPADWLLILYFTAIFGGIYFFISLPLAYYSDFLLPHRFNQSTQKLKDWIADMLKSLLINIPLGLLLLEGVYAVLRLFPSTWWLWAGIGMLFFSVLITNLAPILILPLFNKFIPLGEEHAELEARLMKLAERAHTKVRGIFKYDMSKRTKAASASLTGIGNTRRVLLGDTLINEFTPDEIETILAHELGHHVNKDIPILIASSSVLTLGGLYLVSLGLNWAAGAFGFSGAADIAGLPAFGLVIEAFSLITQPLGNALSRWRESLADAYALKMTGKAEAFSQAFIRLANQNLGEVDPEKWVVFMFYDHPPLGERIKKAQAYRPV